MRLIMEDEQEEMMVGGSGTERAAYFDSARFGRMLDAALLLANDGDGMTRDELASEMVRRGFKKFDARKVGETINDARGTRVDEFWAFVDILQPPGGPMFFVSTLAHPYRDRVLVATARR